MEVGVWGMAGSVVATFATAATTWVFSRKQSRVELGKLEQEIATMKAERESEMKSAEVQIMEQYRELYTKMLSDVGAQLEHLKKENSDIRKENTERRDISDNMRREIQALHIELEVLRAELKQIKNTYPCTDCPRRLP
jgi:DNA repair exonuclease SbcCD ATPase subunit